MRVVLATKNSGKLRELKALAYDLPDVELVLAPDEFDPIEDGDTFVANAIIKARAAALMTGLHSVADDSGIEVYALDRRPGIKSARYVEGSDTDRCRALHKEVLETGNPNKGAAYVCAMAVCSPTGEVLTTTEARWEGSIHEEERGTNGFGYDPIFYLYEYQQTAAEMPPDEKNKVSHRAQAWRSISDFIKSIQLA